MKVFGRVWQYTKRYPGYAVATLAMAVFSNLAGMVFPKLTGLVIDRVIHAHHPELLLRYVVLVAGAFFLRDLLNSLRIQLNNMFEQHVIFDLRYDLYRVLQHLPLGWYDQRASGDLMTRVGEDVTSVERVLIDGIEQGVVALLQIIGVGILLFWTNARLALWMLLPVPFLFAGAIWYTMTARDRYRRQRRAASAMNSLLLDNLQGIRQIKSYAREEEEQKRFAESANEVRRTTLQVMRVWSWYSPSMSFLGALGAVIVLWIGGADLLNQTGFTQGELVMFLLYVGMFYEPIGKLHQLNQLVQAGRAAGERVFEIIDSPQEKYGIVAATRTAHVEGKIEYQDVGFEYRTNLPVLHDINLQIPAGSRLALVGPTGAGKTTIVNLLCRFYESTSGVIRIDHRDITNFSLPELRRQIGLVSQENFLFNGTIRENLLFGRPDATDAEIEEASRAAHAHEFISKLPEGYRTHVGERGVKLSVGEKQRISIARALLKNPPILVLDEATASVDTGTERLIQEALERLLKNRTSIIIAHRLSTIRSADQIAVLKDGRVVELGNHETLLEKNGLYARLCRIQAGDVITENQFQAALN